MELLKAPGARITGVWDIEVFMEEENGGRRPKQLRVYLPSRAPPAERHPNALPRSRLASPRRLSCLAPAPARLAPPRPCPPSTSATPYNLWPPPLRWPAAVLEDFFRGGCTSSITWIGRRSLFCRDVRPPWTCVNGGADPLAISPPVQAWRSVAIPSVTAMLRFV